MASGRLPRRLGRYLVELTFTDVKLVLAGCCRSLQEFALIREEFAACHLIETCAARVGFIDLYGVALFSFGKADENCGLVGGVGQDEENWNNQVA